MEFRENVLSLLGQVQNALHEGILLRIDAS